MSQMTGVINSQTKETEKERMREIEAHCAMGAFLTMLGAMIFCLLVSIVNEFKKEVIQITRLFLFFVALLPVSLLFIYLILGVVNFMKKPKRCSNNQPSINKMPDVINSRTKETDKERMRDIEAHCAMCTFLTMFGAIILCLIISIVKEFQKEAIQITRLFLFFIPLFPVGFLFLYLILGVVNFMKKPKRCSNNQPNINKMPDVVNSRTNETDKERMRAIEAHCAMCTFLTMFGAIILCLIISIVKEFQKESIQITRLFLFFIPLFPVGFLFLYLILGVVNFMKKPKRCSNNQPNLNNEVVIHENNLHIA